MQFGTSIERMWCSMQLFWLEVKKIFSWKLIFLVILINILLYQVILGFDLKYFPNGRPAGDHFKIEQQIIPKYGAVMDEAEFLDFKATYERKVTEVEDYLANDPKAIEAGLDSYEAFRNYDYNNEKQSGYHDEIFFHSKEDFPWELQAYEWYIGEAFEHREDVLNSMIRDATGGQKERYEQFLEEGKFSSYTDVVTQNFQSYKTSMAIVIFFSIVILISPIFLRDVRAGVVPLQYTSKKGRGVYRTKWLAGLVSSVFITTVLLIFYMTLYSTNNTSSHFDLPLYSFGWTDYWYDITFLQYIIVSVLVIFVLSILLGVLTMAISSVVPNAIILIGVQIIVMFVMIAGVAGVLVKDLMNMRFAQIFVPSSIVLFCAGIILLMWFVWRKEGRKDII